MKRHLSDKGIMPPTKRSCSGIRNTAAIELGFEQEDVKLGTETEAEKHMKTLLEKQLDTKITITDQFAQHRSFTIPCTYTPLTSLVQGTCSLKNYQNLENVEEKYQELQSCGLTKDEINFYLNHSGKEHSGKNGSFSANPEIQKQRLQQINEKIASHQKELEECERFSRAKILSRHAMEIEKTLYAGCSSKKQLSFLIKEKTESTLSINDPFSHIKKVSDEISQRVRKERRKKRKQKASAISVSENKSSSEQEDSIEYNPNIHHVIVPLEPGEIVKNKLSIEEIKNHPKFKNYNPGEPNKIIYVKNLHSKVTVRDLQVIFGAFDSDSSNCIHYRLLTGRLKGQAFITFADVETARKALECANGYLLINRPIIIEYGKKR